MTNKTVTAICVITGLFLFGFEYLTHGFQHPFFLFTPLGFFCLLALALAIISRK